MPWQIVILLFGSFSNILSSVSSMLRVPLTWSFLLMSVSLRQLRVFLSYHFSQLSINLPSLNSFGCVSRVKWRQHSHSHGERFLLRLHLRLIQISLLASSLFVSLLHIYLCWPIPSFNYPSVPNISWVNQWETEATKLHTLLSMHGHKDTATNYGQTLK